jgi:hypothetical protein
MLQSLLAGARFIGLVNTTLLLAVVFLLVLTPIGVVFRLLKGSPLEAGEDTTGWRPRGAEHDLERQF